MFKVPSTKFKEKHFKPKNQKSKLLRANEPLLSVFMWAINHTIKELNHVNIPIVLLPDDFEAFKKVRKDNHLYQRDLMPSNFKIKEYCPLVFRNLRERFSIHESHYLRSLTKFQPTAIDRLSSDTGAPAKFYLSYDNQLILKRLSSDEVETMHHLLNEYHAYIVERHGKTLLPKFLGMYRLTVEGQVTYIVVMRNIFSSRLPVHKKYDLKGLNLDREASEKERGKDLPCFKDNDFIRDGTKLYLDSYTKTRLIDTLEADTTFLSRENLIDYSLCLGIHDCNKSNQQESADLIPSQPDPSNSKDDDDDNDDDANIVTAGDSHIFKKPQNADFLNQADNITDEIGILLSSSSASSVGRQIFFLGLVDSLTQFKFRERIVTYDPEQYRKKFMEFVAKAIITDSN